MNGIVDDGQKKKENVEEEKRMSRVYELVMSRRVKLSLEGTSLPKTCTISLSRAP